jgi:hypothetical protein
MSTATETIEGLVKTEYKYGFVTDVEADAAPPSRNSCWTGGSRPTGIG